MHPDRSEKITRALGVNPQEKRTDQWPEYLDVSRQVEKDRNSNVNYIKKRGKEGIGDSNEIDQLLFKTRKKKHAPLLTRNISKPKTKKQITNRKKKEKKLAKQTDISHQEPKSLDEYCFQQNIDEIISPSTTTPEMQKGFEVCWLIFTIMFYNIVIAITYMNLSTWMFSALFPLVGAGTYNTFKRRKNSKHKQKRKRNKYIRKRDRLKQDRKFQKETKQHRFRYPKSKNKPTDIFNIKKFIVNAVSSESPIQVNMTAKINSEIPFELDTGSPASLLSHQILNKAYPKYYELCKQLKSDTLYSVNQEKILTRGTFLVDFQLRNYGRIKIPIYVTTEPGIALLGRDFIYKAKPDLIFINGRYQLKFRKKNKELFGFNVNKINLLPDQTKITTLKSLLNTQTKLKPASSKQGNTAKFYYNLNLRKLNL